MTTLGPGTRVKCVLQGEWDRGQAGPSLGSVWTVKRIIRSFFHLHGPWLELREWADDTWFNGDFFVPLDGNEDISVFTAMLDKLPVNHKQPATVGGGL